MSSQTNSSVYVAVRVLQPRRQMKVLPKSGRWRATFPEGNLLRKRWSDVTCALPLMEARGFTSHDGEM